MSEKRLPKRVILVRKGAETVRKIEVFSGFLFLGKTFVDVLGNPIEGNRSGLYRLRVDSKWFPARKKMLYDQEQLNKIILSLIKE